MKNSNHSFLQKKYFVACATAIAAAFITVNLYPEQHGMKPGFTFGLLLLSAAILGLFVFIVYKVYTEQPDGEHDETVEPEKNLDAARQKKMFFIWSAFAVFLCVPLFRYPLQEYFFRGVTLDIKSIFSLSAGTAITGFTLFNIVKIFKK